MRAGLPAPRTSLWRVWAACLSFRALNALCVSTYYVPDEYWQATEVAYVAARRAGAADSMRGDAYTTWEWQPEHAIRSFVYPSVFHLWYVLVRAFFDDSAIGSVLVARGPAMLQALLFAATTDVLVFRIAQEMWQGRHAAMATAKWALLTWLASWYGWYSMTRTLSNGVEALVAAAVVWAFLHRLAPTALSRDESRQASLLLWKREAIGVFVVVLGAFVRPSCAILAAWVGFDSLLVRPHGMVRRVMVGYAPAAVAALSLGLLVDRWYYGAWTFTPWRFIHTNIVQNVASLYGLSAPTWLVTSGLTTVIAAWLPWLIASMKRNDAHERGLLFLSMAYALAVTASPHKEFRFLLPVAPLLHVLIGRNVATWLAETPATEGNQLHTTGERRRQRRRWTVLIVVLLNLMVGFYFGAIHQRGSVHVMANIRAWLSDHVRDGATPTVLLAVPCHATPLLSHLHLRNASHAPARVFGSLRAYEENDAREVVEAAAGNQQQRLQAQPSFNIVLLDCSLACRQAERRLGDPVQCESSALERGHAAEIVQRMLAKETQTMSSPTSSLSSSSALSSPQLLVTFDAIEKQALKVLESASGWRKLGELSEHQASFKTDADAPMLFREVAVWAYDGG